jgi:uncharacterized protein (DUF983 family)
MSALPCDSCCGTRYVRGPYGDEEPCDHCDGTGIDPDYAGDPNGALTILLLLGIGILGFELAMALWVNLARWVLQ